MSFIPGVIVGGLLGAALAWLYTRENRQTPGEQGSQLTTPLDEILPDSSPRLWELTATFLDQQRDRFRRAAEEARRATDRSRHKLMERHEAAKRGDPTS